MDKFTALAEQKENVFLIDWLSFTAHGCTLDDVKRLLGFTNPDIPWENVERFRNGYPMQCFWNGVTISYGADDKRFYKDPTKVRTDMGIFVNLSGTGCRCFESYGSGNWGLLLAELFTVGSDQLQDVRHYNITRIDLAYDDHVGVLDILEIEHDVRHRNYVSKSTYSKIIWSDKQDCDIQGLSIQIGSNRSQIKIRIYDKAAEQAAKLYHESEKKIKIDLTGIHWVRCEMQLRDERATAAAKLLVDYANIGPIVSGILRNYLTFRTPTSDTNKSRWPVAPYWEKMLLNMDKIPLWISPGEEYSFSKTCHWMIKQYGQAIVVLDYLGQLDEVRKSCKAIYPLEELAPKYKNLLTDLERN